MTTFTRPTSNARRLLLLVVVVDLLLLAATGVLDRWLTQGKSFDELPWTKWPLVLLSLGREQTLAAWWSAAVLAAAGVLLLLAASRQRARALAVFGGAVGLGLLALSADELSGFHERVFTDNAETTASAFAGPGPWMAPLVPLAVVALLLFRRLRGALVSWSQLALWAGLACLSSVALQESIETRFYLPGERPTWLLLVEEGTELLGGWLVLAAGLAAVRATQPARSSWRVNPLLLNAIAVVSVLVAAASQQRYGEFAANPQSGLVQWWLGSAAAAAVAVAALLTGATRSLVVAMGLLAVAYGIDAFTWLSVAGAGFDRGGRLVLGLLIAGLALALLRQRPIAAVAALVGSGLLALGEGAASPWEIGAWWLAAAALNEAGTPMPADRVRPALEGTVVVDRVRPEPIVLPAGPPTDSPIPPAPEAVVPRVEAWDVEPWDVKAWDVCTPEEPVASPVSPDLAGQDFRWPEVRPTDAPAIGDAASGRRPESEAHAMRTGHPG